MWGTANIREILYAKLDFHLKKPKTCTLRIWLFYFTCGSKNERFRPSSVFFPKTPHLKIKP